MSVSNISDKNKYLLWVRAGGNCQFEGCNKCLSQDIITKRNFNQAYIAHIVADVAGGPRGCAIRSPQLCDDITNLMLLCDTHHRLIDKADALAYTEARLLQMKKDHEDRIKRLTAMSPEMQSHMVVYRANIGQHTPVMTYDALRNYLLPDHFPAQDHVIDLGLINSPQRDRDESFWSTEVDVMEKQFNERLKQRLQKQEITHLSLFALAPIPLLIKLGTLLNDIQRVNVHQPVRNPKTWNLSETGNTVEYKAEFPTKKAFGKIALNISLSADITNDRITKVLGNDTTIYRLTINEPSNDYLQSKSHLTAFSAAIRKMLNDIKLVHGASEDIHIFPAMPVATAIELGRSWMPKADMPLVIYDENTANHGFVKAIEIRNA